MLVRSYVVLMQLITPQELNNTHLILDCTWFPNKDGHEMYLKEHIKNAIYFDFNHLSSKSEFPHMLPNSFAEFNSRASELGIKESDNIVVYDQVAHLSAPRAAFILELFGHKNVYILDNFKLYKQLNLPLDSGESVKLPQTVYSNEVKPVGKWFKFEDMQSLKSHNIVDARPSGRFLGTEKEPRPIPSGHIEGAVNIPFETVVNSDGHFKSKQELVDLFTSRGVDLTRPSVVMCGSGVTACVVKFALDLVGESVLYDGSWSEWAVRTK